MREISDDLKVQKNQLEQDQPFLLLYELWIQDDGSERFCFCYHDQAVEWDGRQYNPYPIRRGKMTESSEGELNAWPIVVANLDPMMAPLLEQHHGFHGKRVRMILAHRDFLEDPGAALVESAFVEASAVDENQVSLSLGYGRTLKKKVVRRRFNGRCDFRYRDPETCAYDGALPTCDHSLAGDNGCAAHGVDSPIHPRRYGGFPAIPRGG